MTVYDDVFEDEDNPQTIIINALYKSSKFLDILKTTLNLDSTEDLEDMVNRILKSDLNTLESILLQMNK